VDNLDQEYPNLRTLRLPRLEDEPRGVLDLPGRGASITAGAIDLLGILDASQALSSETNVDRLRTRVADVLSKMTGATAVRVLLWNEEAGSWFLPADVDREGHLDGHGRTVSIDESDAQTLPLSAVRYAERTREPLLVNDATRDDRFARDPYLAGLDGCSLMVVPILNRGVLQAMLLLENRLIRGAFSPDRLDGVILIAGQLAVSLDNALTMASLERKVAERTAELKAAKERVEVLSITDPVTSLANRRRLQEVLAAEWRRALRAGQSIAVAMVDVDHFKLFNDQYGHPAGDECLHQIALALRQSIRETDLAARYGGEEFAIIMPGMDSMSGKSLAERVRAAVAGLGQPNPSAPEGVVTVSIGVAAMVPSEDYPVEHLIQRADAELYEAKRGGRNKVTAIEALG
jgi:diguanylate cyclase (GGDEF)-like protein